jgi:hypothetical protein
MAANAGIQQRAASRTVKIGGYWMPRSSRGMTKKRHSDVLAPETNNAAPFLEAAF